MVFCENPPANFGTRKTGLPGAWGRDVVVNDVQRGPPENFDVEVVRDRTLTGLSTGGGVCRGRRIWDGVRGIGGDGEFDRRRRGGTARLARRRAVEPRHRAVALTRRSRRARSCSAALALASSALRASSSCSICRSDSAESALKSGGAFWARAAAGRSALASRTEVRTLTQRTERRVLNPRRACCRAGAPFRCPAAPSVAGPSNPSARSA